MSRITREPIGTVEANRTDEPALEQYFARHALARAALDPYFLGAPLAAWAGRFGLSVEQLAEHLGCPLREMSRLVWYRRPEPCSPRFHDALARIHARTGADPRRLAVILQEQ